MSDILFSDNNNESDAMKMDTVKSEDVTKDVEERKKLEKKLLKEKKMEAKRLADEESLKQKKEKALKGIRYLLNLSEKYSMLFEEKILASNSNRNTAKPLQQRNILQPTIKDMKKAVHGKNQISDKTKYENVSKYLKYFKGGTLRPYQIDGVTWLTVLFENGINGILADEMGLGKTIQVIALICHLLERETLGPYLIVAPLSTIPNWEAEFKRFAPNLPLVVFHGSQKERFNMYKKIQKKYNVGDIKTHPIVMTSYQVPLLEQTFLNKFRWQYIIIDEGHRVKNHKTKLAKVLRSLDSSNRLLLTGTPLQNNITELWALLNFLLPHIFNNVDTFASLLMIEDVQDENKLLEQEEKNNLISTIHRILAPFMLRRLKKDVLHDMTPKKELNVFCPLSKLQRDLYSYVINRNIAKLQNIDSDDHDDIIDQPRKRQKRNYKEDNEDEDDHSNFGDQLMTEEEQHSAQNIKKDTAPYITRLTMQNTMMMFKKIVDHPYLVHFPLDPSEKKKALLINEDLVSSSGKLIVLDLMLSKLKEQGHKVLIFSTLVMMLDFIEEYMILREHTYRRLDGQDSLEARGASISEFNSDPSILAFLLSTRAGGLGLNLTGADTVIFFDRDWNPQVDIQAQDRCHRIGQTKPVVVYTLVAKNTIDEKIITCGLHKRLLEKIVIKDGKFKTLNQADRNKVENELKDLQDLLNKENRTQDEYTCSEMQDLDKLLDRSDLYELMSESRQ